MVILAVLIVSAISCTRVIPVKLELPNKPTYSSDASRGFMPIHDRAGNVMYYKVTVDSIRNLAKDRTLCREYSQTLQSIIKTTH